MISDFHLAIHVVDTLILITVVALLITYASDYMDPASSHLKRWGIALIAGGAAASALELWIESSIPDFGEIVMHTGVALLILRLLLRKRAAPESTQPRPSTGSGYQPHVAGDRSSMPPRKP